MRDTSTLHLSVVVRPSLYDLDFYRVLFPSNPFPDKYSPVDNSPAYDKLDYICGGNSFFILEDFNRVNTCLAFNASFQFPYSLVVHLAIERQRSHHGTINWLGSKLDHEIHGHEKRRE
ncbi:MAG: hypothetical protein MZV63_60055 [Marinilabiliales bacterium]|nr:hypothetical protein [Marinilabiliales bacterium]